MKRRWAWRVGAGVARAGVGSLLSRENTDTTAARLCVMHPISSDATAARLRFLAAYRGRESLQLLLVSLYLHPWRAHGDCHSCYARYVQLLFVYSAAFIVPAGRLPVLQGRRRPLGAAARPGRPCGGGGDARLGGALQARAPGEARLRSSLSHVPRPSSPPLLPAPLPPPLPRPSSSPGEAAWAREGYGMGGVGRRRGQREGRVDGGMGAKWGCRLHLD